MTTQQPEVLPTAFLHYPPKKPALARVDFMPIATKSERGAGWVTVPLIGQPQAMPDLSQLTERGAKAWAGVDAQGLRDGGASPSANAGGPSAHIKEPYTIAEIKAKIDSNDYSAEMLLQHAMLLLDSVQEDAARYRWLRDGEWRDTDLEPFIRLQLNTLWDAKIDAARKQGATQ